jgi:hypothetical protein
VKTKKKENKKRVKRYGTVYNIVAHSCAKVTTNSRREVKV